MADAATLEAQGQLEQALELYVRAQQWEGAARVALGLDRGVEAAQFFLKAHRPYDAAVCFQKAGAIRECLGALLKVLPSSPRYRSACVHVVRVAQSVGTPLMSLASFLKPFTNSKPTTRQEAAALNQVAVAFRKAGQVTLATGIYEHVKAAYPDDAEAAAGLQALAARAQKPKTGSGSGAFAAAQPAGAARSAAGGLPPIAPRGSAPTLPPSAPRGPASAVRPAAASAPRLKAAGLGPLLVARGAIAQTVLDQVLKKEPELGRSDVKLGQVLVARALVKDAVVVQILSEVSGIPWISEDQIVEDASQEAARAMTLEQAEGWQVAPITLNDRQLTVAMRDPRDLLLIDQLRFASGVNQIVGLFATDAAIRRGIDKVYHGVVAPKAAAAERRAPVEVPGWDAPAAPAPAPVAAPAPAALSGAPRSDAPSLEPAAPAPDPARYAPIEVPGWDSTPAAPAPAPAAEASADASRYAPIEIPGLEDEAPPEPAHEADGYVSTARDFDPSDLEKGVSESTLVEASVVTEEAAGEAEVEVYQAAPTLKVGSTLSNRYRLDALLGEGGTAAVFKAFDLEINQDVALKIFRPSTPAESEQLLARFKLELALSRQLAHPNVIRLFDLGSHEGWRFLTMELLEGRDLAQVLGDPGKPLPLLEGLVLLEQFCDALQFVHEQGVVHRDIKPQNVFITTAGQVKLMDFGIAKKQQSGGVTVAGMVLGTPSFISPEQIKSFSKVGHTSDIYSLGATAYAVFTGSPPFTHPELLGLLMAHAHEQPRPMRDLNPGVPAELDAIILRMLEKDPAKRPQTAGEVGEALRALREAIE